MKTFIIWLAIMLQCLPAYAGGVLMLGGGVAAVAAGGTVSYVESAQSSTNSATTVRCTVPSGAVEGDLMVISVLNDLATASLGTNSDWTDIATATGNNGTNQFVGKTLYRVLPATPPAYYDIVTSEASWFCVSTAFEKTAGTWAVRSSTPANSDGSASITSGSVTGYANGALQGAFYDDSLHTVSSAPEDMPLAQYQDGTAMTQVNYYQTGTSATGYTKSITFSATEQLSAVLIAIGAE